MYKLFDSIVRQPLASEVSVELNATESYTISNLDPNGKFYKNDVLQAGTFSIAPGDKLKLAFTTSDKYSCPVFIYFDVNNQKSIVGASTIDDPAYGFNSYYSGKTYFDNLTTTEGKSVLLSSDYNEYHVFNPDGNKILTVDLDVAPTNAPTSYYTYLLEVKTNYVYKIDLNSYTIVKKIQLDAPCVGVAMSSIPNSGKIPCAWISLENGQIICLDKDDKVIQNFKVTGVCMGIDASNDGTVVAVCDPQYGQINVFENSGGKWQHSIVPFGTRPYDVYVDYSKNLWVSSMDGDKVTYYKYGSYDPVLIEVGKGQKTIKQVSPYRLGVVCTETCQFFEIDLTTRKVMREVELNVVPIDFCVSNKDIFIATADSRVVKLQSDDTLVDVADVTDTIYAIEADPESDNFYVICLYHNTPSLLAPSDHVTANLKVFNPLKVYPETIYDIATVKIDDINASLYVGLPEVFNAKLYVNNQRQGNVAKVYDEDSVQLAFTVPDSPKEEIIFPVFAGNSLAYFKSVVAEVYDYIEPFYFQDVLSANPNVPYISNTVTIAGLNSDTKEVKFTVDNGSIIKDGVNTGLKEVMVKNGTTIAVTLTADDYYGEVVYLRADCSEYTEVWSVTVAIDGNRYYLRPEFKNSPLFDTSHDLGSWGEYSFVDVMGNGSFMVTTKSLYATKTEQPTASPLFIADYAGSMVFCIDTVEREVAYNASVNNPFAIAEIPALAAVVSQPQDNIVKVFSLDLANSYDINIASPYGILVVGTDFWVAGGASGGVTHCRYNNTTNKYEWVETINLNGFIYSLAYDSSTGKIYCSDIANSKIKVVDDGMFVEVFDVGVNPYDIEILNGKLYVLNVYDNSGSVIDLASKVVTTKQLEYPAHALVNHNGVLNVINLETNFLQEYTNAMAASFSVDTLLENTEIYSAYGNLVVAHLTNKLHDIVDLYGSPTSLDFNEQLDVPMGVSVTSNEIEISGVVRPEVLTVENFPDATIIKNGVESGRAVTVDNGDKIAIKVTATKYPDTDQYISITADSYRRTFHIRTGKILLPNYIKFNPVFDALTSMEVRTEERTIEGLSDGVSVQIYAEYQSTFDDTNKADSTVSIYVNGLLVSDQFNPKPVTVKNGDLISLGWIVEMQYNTAVEHKLMVNGEQFASYIVYAEELVGPAGYAPFFNFTDLFNFPLYAWKVTQSLEKFSVDKASSSARRNRQLIKNWDDPRSAGKSKVFKTDKPLPTPLLSQIFQYDVVGVILKSNLQSGNQKYPDLFRQTIIADDYGAPATVNPSIVEFNMPSSMTNDRLHVVTKDGYASVSFEYYLDIRAFEDTYTKTREENAPIFSDMPSSKVQSMPTMRFIEGVYAENGENCGYDGLVQLYALQTFTYLLFDTSFGYFAPKTRKDLVYPGYVPLLTGLHEVQLYPVVLDTWLHPVQVYYLAVIEPTIELTAEYEHFIDVYRDLAADYAGDSDVTQAFKNPEYAPPLIYNIRFSEAGKYKDYRLSESNTFSAYPTIYLEYIRSSMLVGYELSLASNIKVKNVMYLLSESYSLHYAALNDGLISGRLMYVDIGLDKSVTSCTQVILNKEYYYLGSNTTLLTQGEFLYNSDEYMFENNELPAAEKGSFDEPGIDNLISSQYELSKIQLSDGTFLYYYLNTNEYGDCVNNRYYVEYGLVRGG